MSPTKSKTTLAREYRDALDYYKKTVWKYIHNTPPQGAPYYMAIHTWRRLSRARHAWFDSLNESEQVKAAASKQYIENELQPRHLQRDASITAESLAMIAAVRLGTPKPTSIPSAAIEAEKILTGMRDHLKLLPQPVEHEWQNHLEAYADNTVTFAEILESSRDPNSLPLLGTSQPNRNKGMLKPRALEQAVTRYGESQSKEVQEEIRRALKNKIISVKLLEKIRWERFLNRVNR